jgi:predicted DNA-binding transcriptional regulator AlpA
MVVIGGGFPVGFVYRAELISVARQKGILFLASNADDLSSDFAHVFSTVGVRLRGVFVQSPAKMVFIGIGARATLSIPAPPVPKHSSRSASTQNTASRHVSKRHIGNAKKLSSTLRPRPLSEITMSDARNPFDLLLDEIRAVIREEIKAAANGASAKGGERLLDPKEAADMLSVSEDWLYHNAKKLPFTRKLGPRLLRFSYQGILKWAESKKFGSA